MQRFFFDLATDASVQYDYRGREMAQPSEARELALLIALDIECLGEDEFANASVEVRNVAGRELFSIPVRSLEVIAA